MTQENDLVQETNEIYAEKQKPYLDAISSTKVGSLDQETIDNIKTSDEWMTVAKKSGEFSKKDLKMIKAQGKKAKREQVAIAKTKRTRANRKKKQKR